MSADSRGGGVSIPGGAAGRGEEQRRGSGAQAAVGGATLPPATAKSQRDGRPRRAEVKGQGSAETACGVTTPTLRR